MKLPFLGLLPLKPIFKNFSMDLPRKLKSFLGFVHIALLFVGSEGFSLYRNVASRIAFSRAGVRAVKLAVVMIHAGNTVVGAQSYEFYDDAELFSRPYRLVRTAGRKILQDELDTPTKSKSNETRTILLTGAAAIAGFVAVGLIVFALIWVSSFAKKIYVHIKNREARATDSRTVAPDPEEDHDESLSLYSDLPRMTMADLKAATHNFDKQRVIGDGGFGFVYKASFPDGMVVAVKKLSPDARQGFREFQAEMDTLTKIKHKNLVEILGYCKSGPERLLIYKYVENGSLDEWLHEREDSRKILDWRKRVKIIHDVSCGLSFLHHDVEPHIIHRDIKASNILLDNEFQAMIIDFGLARVIDPQITHVSTQVAGTMGYMAPEYVGGAIATKQGDVYSFGMLMLEIATGRRPNLKVDEKNKVTLWSWVHKLFKEKKIMQLLDEEIRMSVQDCPSAEALVVEFFELGCQCTLANPLDRPLMKEVVSRMSELYRQSSN